MDQKKITILTISILLILLAGVGLGIIIQMKIDQQKIKDEAVNILSSKVISSVSAYGKIVKIEGENVTLNSVGDDLTVSIVEGTRIYSFLPATDADKTETPTQRIVGFNDLKVGNSVNMVLRLLPSGKFEGVSAIILPEAEEN